LGTEILQISTRSCIALRFGVSLAPKKAFVAGSAMLSQQLSLSLLTQQKGRIVQAKAKAKAKAQPS
jgi:hypothetical protein